MHKTDEEMKKAASFMCYEMGQFRWATARRQECAARGERPRGPERDSHIEVLLFHARILRDFFSRKRPLPERADTDILAADFVDSEGDWTRPVFNYLVQDRTKLRLDRALAHVTYDRAE